MIGGKKGNGEDGGLGEREEEGKEGLKEKGDEERREERASMQSRGIIENI